MVSQSNLIYLSSRNLYWCDSCPCLYALVGEIKCIYLFIYTTCIILTQIEDVECFTQTHPQVNNYHHGRTLRSSSLKCASNRAQQWRTVLQYGQDKIQKHLSSRTLSLDIRQYVHKIINSSRICSECVFWEASIEKMLLKSHLGITCIFAKS